MHLDNLLQLEEHPDEGGLARGGCSSHDQPCEEEGPVQLLGQPIIHNVVARNGHYLLLLGQIPAPGGD